MYKSLTFVVFCLGIISLCIEAKNTPLETVENSHKNSEAKEGADRSAARNEETNEGRLDHLLKHYQRFGNYNPEKTEDEENIFSENKLHGVSKRRQVQMFDKFGWR